MLVRYGVQLSVCPVGAYGDQVAAVSNTFTADLQRSRAGNLVIANIVARSDRGFLVFSNYFST